MYDIVRDAMSTGSPRLPADTSVAASAHVVWENNWLPVPLLDENDQLVGAISIHDIVRAVAQRQESRGDPGHRDRVGGAAGAQPRTSSRMRAPTLENTGSVLGFVVEDDKFLGALTHADIHGP